MRLVRFASLRFASLRFASLRFASLRFASLSFASRRFASLGAVRTSRADVFTKIQHLRDTKLDPACRRAVGVAGRWHAHSLPPQLRLSQYSQYEAKLTGSWVSTYVYNPLEAYLNPTLKLDNHTPLPTNHTSHPPPLPSTTSKSFIKLKENYEKDSHTVGNRRLHLGTMIRTLTSFNSTGIAVDPVTLKIVLPNHYDNVPPPASYGLSTDGKISYMTTVNDTAIGVFSILLVRRFYYAWKKYLEFRNLRKTLFLWGRRRLLKLVWDPLILY